MICTHLDPAQSSSRAGRPLATSRKLAAFATALGAAVVLAACTSSNAGTGNHSGAVVTAATTSASGSTASPGSTIPGASVAQSTVPSGVSPAGGTGCSDAQIAVTATNPPGGAAAGHDGVVLLFTNHSSSPCTLTGYPGVAGLDGSGQQLAQATRTLDGYLAGCGCSAPAVLTLQPGGVVSATVEAVDALNGGPCTSYAALLVTPPNTTQSTKLSLAPYSCDFDVHPVVAGQTGSARPN